MKHTFGIAAATLALTACGGGTTDADADGDGTITTDEARAMVEASQVKPQAGKYATSMQLLDAKIPGAPPEAVQMMGGAMNRKGEFCLTAEEAERGFKQAIEEGQSEACSIQTFTIEGNDVKLAMTCAGEGLGEMAVDMNGKVTPTSSNMTMVMNGTIPEMGAVEMTMAFEQERIGECDG